MARYESDLAELIAAVKRCLPHSRLFCWRTAPLPPTDSRTHHFWLKPPYVVAAMNAVGLHLARRCTPASPPSRIDAPCIVGIVFSLGGEIQDWILADFQLKV